MHLYTCMEEDIHEEHQCCIGCLMKPAIRKYHGKYDALSCKNRCKLVAGGHSTDCIHEESWPFDQVAFMISFFFFIRIKAY